MCTKTTMAITAAAALAGCVTSISSRMDGVIHWALGNDIRSAIAAWGYPDSEREILGDKVYVWSSSHQSTIYLPATTTTNGYVGGESFSATTMGTEAMNLHFFCEIQLAADANGKIKHIQWRGNGGCGQYAQRLGY